MGFLRKEIFTLIFIFVSLLTYAGGIEFTIVPKGENGEIVSVSWAKVYLGDKEVDFVACDKVSGIVINLDFDNNYRIELQSKNYETIEIGRAHV